MKHTTPCRSTPLAHATIAGLSLALLAGSLAAADVAANWNTHCVACHGKDGSGQTRMGRQSGAKDYRDPAVQAGMKDDAALKILQEGLTEKGKERMKPFKDKLSEDEMKALIAHIRTFKQ